MTYNSYPQQPENRVTAHREIIQFSDGDAAFICRTQGDRMQLGYGSPYRLTEDRHGFYTAIIATEAGESFGVAMSFLITGPSGGARLKPQDTFDVTVGEPCETLRVLGTTSPVASVMVHSAMQSPNILPDEYQLPEVSPFHELREQAIAIRDAVPRT